MNSRNPHTPVPPEDTHQLRAVESPTTAAALFDGVEFVASNSSRRLLLLYVRPLAVRCGLADLVEDLVQDALCRVLERELDPATRFRGRFRAQWQAYLRRIARSAVLDALRRRTAVRRSQEEFVEISASVEESATCPRPDALARLLARDRVRGFLRDCRRALPPRRSRQRDLAIVRWAWCEGWSSREIARRLEGELTPARVDSLLHRLRARLRARGVVTPSRAGEGRGAAA
jgi:RNA polymerase sigma factor (sigma-70 family)